MKPSLFIIVGPLILQSVQTEAADGYVPEVYQEALNKIDQAEAYFGAGKYREAARLFGEAYEVTSMQRALMYDYARCFTNLGDDKSAEPLYQEVLRAGLDAKRWDSAGNTFEIVNGAHLQLGAIYERRKWWKLALSEYEQTSGTNGWAARHAAGMIYAREFANYPQAIKLLELALRVRPDEADIKMDLAACYNDLGTTYVNAHDDNKAAAAFQKALEYRPGWDAPLNNLAKITARRALAAARAVAPSPPPLEMNKGQEPPPDLPKEMVTEFFGVLDAYDVEKLNGMLKTEPKLARAEDGDGQTGLFHVKSGEMAEALIRAGANVKFQDRKGKTPLHAAATQDDTGIAAALLAHGADLNACDKDGRTPLHDAVVGFAGAIDTLKLLLDKGAWVDFSDNFDSTPLMTAAQFGDQDLVDLLLAYGADPTKKDKLGRTAADHAAKNHPDLAAHLRALAAIDAHPKEAILQATRSRDAATVRRLIAVAPSLALARDVTAGFGGTVLHEAAAHGFDDIVALLVAAKIGIDVPDDLGDTALHLAARNGQDATVKLLVAAGASLSARNKTQETPLMVAARAESENPCVALLIGAGADVNATGIEDVTPLELAVMGKRPDAVALLLEHGANPKAADTKGFTPLHLADKACAALLVAKGADVNAQGSAGSPLQVRASDGDRDAVAFLIAHGAAVNARDHEGLTALHVADKPCAELLIAKGADINATGPSGTPLHTQAANHQPEVVEFLLAHNAKVNARDGKGRTPLDVAREAAKAAEDTYDDAQIANAKKVIELLLAHGAKPGKDLG